MKTHEFKSNTLQELERRRQEQQRNQGRMARYNVRRINAGYDRLSEADQVDRAHGLTRTREKLRNLTTDPAVQPQHRDEIELLSR